MTDYRWLIERRFVPMDSNPQASLVAVAVEADTAYLWNPASNQISQVQASALDEQRGYTRLPVTHRASYGLCRQGRARLEEHLRYTIV